MLIWFMNGKIFMHLSLNIYRNLWLKYSGNNMHMHVSGMAYSLQANDTIESDLNRCVIPEVVSQCDLTLLN